MQKTFDSYRTMKASNKKILTETIDRLQQEKNDLALEKAKLGSQAEYSMEKCKTLASTVKSLRAQVQTLEQKCNSYLQTTTRLEESHRQLRQVGPYKRYSIRTYRLLYLYDLYRGTL